MFNLVKANLYRFKKSKRYAWAVLFMYLTGIIGVISTVKIASSDADIMTIGLGVERLIISCCLIVMPICFINFFYKRDEVGQNKKELLILKDRMQLVIADGLTILFINMIVITLFLLIAILTLLVLNSLPVDLIRNILLIIIKSTLLITAITDFSMIFEYWLNSFLLPVILVILIVTGNMHIIIKFILELLGYGSYSAFTLSGISVYYEYQDLAYILLSVYIILYNIISIIIVSRKEY